MITSSVASRLNALAVATDDSARMAAMDYMAERDNLPDIVALEVLAQVRALQFSAIVVRRLADRAMAATAKAPPRRPKAGRAPATMANLHPEVRDNSFSALRGLGGK